MGKKEEGQQAPEGEQTSKQGDDPPYSLLPSGTLTLMFRYIPRRFTAEDVVSELQAYIPTVGFDFVYVPKYRTSKCNMGYAFVNFTATEYALLFATRLATLQKSDTTLETQFSPQMKVEAAQGFAANYHRIMSDPTVNQEGCVRILHEGEVIPLEMVRTCKEITPTTSPSGPDVEAQGRLQDSSTGASSTSAPRKVSQVATIATGADGLWQGSSSEEDEQRRAFARTGQIMEEKEGQQSAQSQTPQGRVPSADIAIEGPCANGASKHTQEEAQYAGESSNHERSRDEVQILLEQLHQEGMF
eukprot:CAMPEP_0206583254 /NCGR_PEP_ID=MMETSP0325_2-20121206/34993_1 /ASSEMBLY_ACC=CAM_ASM_000347 /TAXON_ID=2866 /ORGANISM="Crypthecodinium cohnii, Strain Seligo" /LENGTH=300 /DNA_ID=CAMNT_0054090137 /DNA_START=289 /DNA_END=1191 /DNA_ORIENTATION=+